MNAIKLLITPVSLSLLMLLASASHAASGNKVDEVLARYQSQGASTPDAERGKAQWMQSYTNNKKGESRNCTSCHTKNLQAQGKHVNTGKPIEPLAPSVNAERLTDSKKIEKWFKRNCKWTLGRECSAQEKSDFLSYIRSQ
jgi:hypothetical protein